MRNVVTDSCVNYLGGGGMTLSHLAGWNSMQYGWRENCDLGGGWGKTVICSCQERGDMKEKWVAAGNRGFTLMRTACSGTDW